MGSVAMMVLRKGGRFADSRIRFYLWTSVGLLVLAVTAFAISHSFRQPAFGFFAVAAIVILFKASVRRWARWFLGRKGESAVTETLKSLPDDYVVLNDIVLPDRKGNVDHVLIGPNGVFVIETKNYSGFVRCEEDEWFMNGHRIRSLTKQAKRNSMAVRGYIASLFPGPQSKVPYIVPLLVFVSSHTRLELFKPTVCVLKVNELVEFIRDRETKRVITDDEKRAMVHHLQLLQRNFAETSDWSATVEDGLPKAG
jgi:Nuclease-related domain